MTIGYHDSDRSRSSIPIAWRSRHPWERFLAYTVSWIGFLPSVLGVDDGFDGLPLLVALAGDRGRRWIVTDRDLTMQVLADEHQELAGVV